MKSLKRFVLGLFILMLTISFSGFQGFAVVKVSAKSKVVNDSFKGRQIKVYLPAGYDGSKERFPVVYMQDGENLFGTGDVQWALAKTLDKLISDKKIGKVIVVGITSSDSRADEYSPYKDDRSDGKGAAYADYLAKKIVPYIDGKYRTIAKREKRAIMGSSLGGLISFWAGMKYSNVFSMIGAMSPYIEAGNEQLLKDLDKIVRPGMKVWMDMGAKEFDAGLARLAVDTLLKKGYKYGRDVIYLEDKDGEGNEASWGNRAAYPLILFNGTKAALKLIDYKVQVENSECAYFRKAIKYTIINPVGEFDNGLKYTLLEGVKYAATGRASFAPNEDVVDDGKVLFKTHIEGNLKTNGEAKTEVTVNYNGIEKKVIIEDKSVSSSVSTLRVEFINAPENVRGKTAYWNGEVGAADQPVVFDSTGRGSLILMKADIEAAAASGHLKSWGDEGALNGKLLRKAGDWSTAINTSDMGNNKIDLPESKCGTAVVDLSITNSASAAGDVAVEFINAPADVRGKTAYWNGEAGAANQPVQFDSAGRGTLVLTKADIDKADLKAWGDPEAVNGKLLKASGNWDTAIANDSMSNNKIDISEGKSGTAVIDLSVSKASGAVGVLAIEFINAPEDVKGKTAYWNGEAGSADQAVAFDSAGRGILVLKKSDMDKANLKAWGDETAVNGKLLKAKGNWDTAISNDSMSNNKIGLFSGYAVINLAFPHAAFPPLNKPSESSEPKNDTAVTPPPAADAGASTLETLRIIFVNAPADVRGKTAYWNGEAGAANQPVIFDNSGRGTLILLKGDMDKADLKAWGAPEALNGKLLKTSGNWDTQFGTDGMGNIKIDLSDSKFGTAVVDLAVTNSSTTVGAVAIEFVNAPSEVQGKTAFWNGEAGTANQPVIFDSAGRGTLVLTKAAIDKADLKAWGAPEALNGKLLKVSGNWDTQFGTDGMGNIKIDLTDSRYGTAFVDLSTVNYSTYVGVLAIEFINSPAEVQGKTVFWNGEAGSANQPVLVDSTGRGILVLKKADIEKADLKAWGDPGAVNGKLLKVSGNWDTQIGNDSMSNNKIGILSGNAIINLSILKDSFPSLNK